MVRKKLIPIDEDIHKAFKAYCDANGFKITDKAGFVLTDFLLKEAGGTHE